MWWCVKSIQEIVSEHLADRELYNALHEIVTGSAPTCRLRVCVYIIALKSRLPSTFMYVVAEALSSGAHEAAMDAMMDARCINVQNVILNSFLRSTSAGKQGC